MNSDIEKIQSTNIISRFIRFLNINCESPHEKMESKESLWRKQIGYSSLTARFCIVLALAAFIASLGLMIDSSVIVIGAMLIAPLMRPILALAYGFVAMEKRIILRSLITAIIGVLITVLTAVGTEHIFNLTGPTQELLNRTQPSLIDLGVAIAAGLAATIAINRPNIADSLPGVAVAVALVPPVCAVGLFLSVGSTNAAIGAMTLFVINFAAIVLCAILVFVVDGYGAIWGALLGALVMSAILIVLSPALLLSLEEISAKDKIQMEVVSYLRDYFEKFGDVHPYDLSRVLVEVHDDHISSFVEIEAPASTFTKDRADELFRRIDGIFDVPVNLKIQTLVTEEVTLYPYQQSEGVEPKYGVDVLVPRK